MNKLTRLFISISLLFNIGVLTLLSPVEALAQTNSRKIGINCSTIREQSEGSVDPACGGNIAKLISTVVTIIFIVAALLALFYLIYGGVKYILSGGNKDQTASARQMIIAAIIGLAIVFLSFVVIKVLGAVFGFDITNLTLPSFNKIGD